MSMYIMVFYINVNVHYEFFHDVNVRYNEYQVHYANVHLLNANVQHNVQHNVHYADRAVVTQVCAPCSYPSMRTVQFRKV